VALTPLQYNPKPPYIRGDTGRGEGVTPPMGRIGGRDKKKTPP